MDDPDAETVESVFRRDGLICVWCTRSVVRLRPADGRQPDHCATIDHVVARSAGGSNHENNLVVACHQCNQSRSRESGTPGLLSDDDLLRLME